MKILGFAFTKIHADKKTKFDMRSNKSINIDFLNITKENIDIVKSDAVYNINFGYNISYLEPNSKKDNKQAEIILEGVLTVDLDKTEDKDFSKTYKKKEMNNQLKELIFNFLLRKCSPRAVELEDQLNLPLHITIPQVKIGNTNESDR